MDLLNQTKQICQKYGIKPSRSKGQNFLISDEVYNRIVEIGDLSKEDIVLEVGPGLGFLTQRLARKAKKVIAVELDDKLANVVEERIKEQEIENVEVVNEDILKLISKLEIHPTSEYRQNSKLIRNSKFEIRNLKVVANIPYNITSHFLRLILSRPDKPESMTLMLQKEVAERIVAKPGKMSKLAVSVQFYASAKIIDYVDKDNFWPQPKVDSAIIQLQITNDKLRIKNIDEQKFFQLVKYGFSAKRKMLKNNLAAGYRIKPTEAGKLLKMADFRENIRAQELSVTDWLKLFGKIE